MNAVKSSLERLAMDQEKFLKVQRKVRLDTVLQPVTNPMFRRAISLDALLTPDGVVFVVEAGQIALAQNLLDNVVPLIKDVADMVTLDADLHLVALTSALGWKTVTHLELPNKKKEDGLVESFSSLEVHAAEKELLKYSEAMAKTKNHLMAGRGSSLRGGYSGGGSIRDGGAGGGRGGGGKANRKGSNKGAGGVGEGVSGGHVDKPRRGGCHRCGGPHFERSCSAPYSGK